MADYKYEFVKVRVRDGIAWASLNRPDKRNAMSPQLHYDMDDALARLAIDEDDQGRGADRRGRQLLRRPGPADVLPRLQKNPGERKKATAAANRWRWERLSSIRRSRPSPWCTATASAAPSRSCSPATSPSRPEDATFGLSEVNWGILPGALVSKVVTDMVLPRHALYYACLGRSVRRQGGGADRHDRLRGAARGKLEEAVTGSGGEADEEDPGGAARDQAGDPSLPHHGRGAVLRIPRRQGPGHQGRRQGEDSYNTGLRQFLDQKSYKPTFEPFKLGTLLIDQRSAKR